MTPSSSNASSEMQRVDMSQSDATSLHRGADGSVRRLDDTSDISGSEMMRIDDGTNSEFTDGSAI